MRGGLWIRSWFLACTGVRVVICICFAKDELTEPCPSSKCVHLKLHRLVGPEQEGPRGYRLSINRVVRSKSSKTSDTNSLMVFTK